eukprot:19400-Heterococcus_DN1.PRE.3
MSELSSTVTRAVQCAAATVHPTTAVRADCGVHRHRLIVKVDHRGGGKKQKKLFCTAIIATAVCS